ncbi:MAG: hypothetical protein GC155_07815 [Alphaproteobacteria bacterium]|nr:hypothetical protein [Alphaproteobacteria bacterium]
MSGSSHAAQRATIDELAALLHMARFMSSQIPGLVPNHLRLSQQLETLESELEWELEQAKSQMDAEKPLARRR